jgi:hypothetical protein
VPTGSPAFAEEAPLSKIRGFSCEFPISTANGWEGDAPKPVIEDGKNFAFGLDSIDTAKGTARMVAGNTVLFEKLVNIVHDHAPHARLCFNTKPTDTAEAVQRWLK